MHKETSNFGAGIIFEFWRHARAVLFFDWRRRERSKDARLQDVSQPEQIAPR